MSGGEDPRKADIEQANSQLEQGLKSCRSVIANYKVILAGERAANLNLGTANDADPAAVEDGFGDEPA